MAIRSTVKAIIIRDGSVLLNKCVHRNGMPYYDLPGGGQHQYEAMEDALRREVMEETGYTVASARFAALAEDIFTDKGLREKYPDYSHRIYHIFAVTLADAPQRRPTEVDWGMETSVWVSVEQLGALEETYPAALEKLVKNILGGGAPMYLGTKLIDDTDE